MPEATDRELNVVPFLMNVDAICSNCGGAVVVGLPLAERQECPQCGIRGVVKKAGDGSHVLC